MARGASGALQTSGVESKNERAACFGDKSFHTNRLPTSYSGNSAAPTCFNCAVGATRRGASAALRHKQRGRPQRQPSRSPPSE